MDMKDGHGAYFYTPSVVNNCMHSEIYYGHWRENQKDKIGIYIWLREMQGLDREENKLEGVDFDAFVGEIENDCYSRGCYLTKLGESFYVYYGGFDQEGHKNDDNGLFYDNVRDSIFKGKIVNDKFVSGYLISFDDYGELKNMIYVEIDDNDLPIKLLKPEEIEENIKSTVLEQAKSFKSALVDFDYFTDIYEKVIEIRKFVNTKLDNLAIFDSNQDYPKMFKMSSEYNLNNMYREVKKKEKYFLD
jgi:hypothetical protein